MNLQRLLEILRAPDNPDARLHIKGDELVGAGYRVPLVDGIPDFVTYAAPAVCTLAFDVPISIKPNADVLTEPPVNITVPPWFTELATKYPFLATHPRGFLLDVGAGQGNRAIYDRLGYDYLGLDIHARGEQSEQRLTGPVDLDVIADCHRLPLASSSIEVVNSTAVIEHLYCPWLAMREVHRVLRPGGLVVGSCSFLEGEHFDSQYHMTQLGLYRTLALSGLEVRHLWAGLSLWESHSGSIFMSLPGNRRLGQLHRWLYLALTDRLASESAEARLRRSAAVFNFVAVKR